MVIKLLKSGLSSLEIRPDTTIFVEGFACLHFLTRCSILLITALGLSPHDRLLVPPINVTVSGLYVDIMSSAFLKVFSFSRRMYHANAICVVDGAHLMRHTSPHGTADNHRIFEDFLVFCDVFLDLGF